MFNSFYILVWNYFNLNRDIFCLLNRVNIILPNFCLKRSWMYRLDSFFVGIMLSLGYSIDMFLCIIALQYKFYLSFVLLRFSNLFHFTFYSVFLNTYC